jgi:preprotein translocase subunit SecF
MKRIDFLAHRRFFYALTLIVLLGTPLLLTIRHLTPGLDFTGGTEFLLDVDQKLNETHIRQALTGELEIVRVAGGQPGRTHFHIRTHHSPEAARSAAHQLEQALDRAVGAGKTQVLSSDSVGPLMGGAQRLDTVWALLWATVGILAYMSIRFDWRPGVASTLALLHDAFVILALFALTGMQVDLSVVAALLTVLGYSMNDSIVILDRVRENRKRFPGVGLEETVNLSLNQCFARTVYTSLTVLFILLALFATGPAPLRGFVLAMTAGVITGTLSTITVVCPVLVDWERIAVRGRPSRSCSQ